MRKIWQFVHSLKILRLFLRFGEWMDSAIMVRSKRHLCKRIGKVRYNRSLKQPSVIFAPPHPGGYLSVSRDICGCHKQRLNLLITAATHPAMHMTAPYNKEISGPNICTAVVEKTDLGKLGRISWRIVKPVPRKKNSLHES